MRKIENITAEAQSTQRGSFFSFAAETPANENHLPLRGNGKRIFNNFIVA
jgi:hypothetical protein